MRVPSQPLQAKPATPGGFGGGFGASTAAPSPFGAQVRWLQKDHGWLRPKVDPAVVARPADSLYASPADHACVWRIHACCGRLWSGRQHIALWRRQRPCLPADFWRRCEHLCLWRSSDSCLWRSQPYACLWRRRRDVRRRCSSLCWDAECPVSACE